MLSIKLALAYFQRRKLRALLTMLSVTAAMAALVALQGLNHSISDARREAAGLLGGKAHLEVKAPQGGINESLLAKVEKTPGIESAVPSLRNSAQVRKLPGFTLIMGVVFGEDEEIRSYQLKQGRLPIKDRQEILVPNELLREIQGQVGDSLQIQTMQGMRDFTVVGSLADSGVARTNQGAVVFMPLLMAQKAFGLEDKLSCISVVLHNPADTPAMQKTLGESLGNGVEVITPLQQNGEPDKMLRFLMSLDNVYGLIGLFLALYVVYNSMRVAVSEQNRQFGILRALGWGQWEIRKLVAVQAMIIGVAGSLLGLGLGTYLAEGLLNTVRDSLSEVFKISISHIRFTAGDYAAFGLMGMFTCLISAWLPARGAADISPVEAMSNRSSQTEPGYLGWRAVLGGGLFLASGLILIYGNSLGFLFQAAMLGIMLGAAVLMPPCFIFFLQKIEPLAEKLFGLTGRLGSSSLRCRPRRSVATGMPILLGLAVAFGFLGTLTSVNETFSHWVSSVISPDLVITQGLQTFSSNQVGLPESLLERVRQVEGVKAAAGLRTTGIQWQGNPIDLQMYDFSVDRHLMDPLVVEPSKDEAWEAMAREKNIWISQSLAIKYGVHRGEKLKIPTPNGTIEFSVVAVVKDFSSYNGSVYMNRQDYIRYWRDSSFDYIYLTLEPGVSPAFVQELLEGSLKNDFRTQVVLASEFREGMISLNSDICNIFNFIIIIILLVAAVGTTNSLLISVLEKRREIGALRVVGYTRGQIRGMLMIEVGLLFFAGIVLAIPTAAAIQIACTVFDKNVNGWVLDIYIPWLKMIGVSAAMFLAVGLSVVYPAWLASRVDSAQVLHSE
nr:ABC transporter permease [Desulfosporosinus orientis]